MSMRAFMLAVSGVALAAIGCSSDGTTVVVEPKKDPVPVASVAVTLPSASLTVGQSQRAEATLHDANGAVLTGRSITWQSSSTSIASVTDAGMVAALAPGSITVSAVSEGVTGTASMTVNAPPPVPVASVSVSLVSSSLNPGQTTQATAVLKDANGNQLTGRTVTWQSSATNVATVSNAGLVSAVAAGSASITATSEGQTGSATLTVSVPPPVPVATVSVSLASSTINPGQTTQATAVLKDANGNQLTGRTVTWQSSANNVATVSSDGLVSAVAAGSASITATSESKTGSATLTVNAPPPVPVASVTVSPSAPSVQVGSTVQLSAVTRDANGNILTGRTITWSSNNTGIATVSASGLVTAVAAGTAIITASCGSANGTSTVTSTTPPPPPPTAIFSDDFESGSMSKWNESNSTTQAVINDASNAHGGSRFLRMTYGINGGDAAWLNKYLAPGYRQLYVRYYVRFSTNWVGSTKMVALRGAPINQPTLGLGRAGICPNGRDSYTADLVTKFAGGDAWPSEFYVYWQDMWADSNGQCWGRYGPTPSTMPYFTPMPELSKGVWHKIELTAKENSSATAADGAIRFWIDGVKYGEWTNIRFGDPAFVNFEVLTLSGQGTGTQIQYVDVDDLVLTSDFPSSSQP
ncbi:MAG TPA: Ig-like domain-containing protein [Gemmatimonadaceae bacterium]|nr:Ig-like domain-containing protein [Gemmatimonadaceae bacterium]